MKDRAIEICRNVLDAKTGKNLLREFLQHVILRKIFELNLSKKIVFHGGTALRIIHRMNRFSEDLDFHLLVPDENFKIQPIMQSIVKELELNAYSVTLNERGVGAVQTVYFKFSHILNETGLSPLTAQNLIIKFDIDTNPPLGFITEKSKVNQYFPFSVQHHDPPSFLAGKLHAILQRSYPKGRDVFDLMFYLTRWKEMLPNLDYLNQALTQTKYDGKPVTKNSWKRIVKQKLTDLDWTIINQDVLPFLEAEVDLQLIEKDSILQLLE